MDLLDKPEVYVKFRFFVDMLVRRYSRKPRILQDEKLQLVHRVCIGNDFRKRLSDPIERTRFVALDTETTGFRVYSRDQIVSIAMVELTGLEITGRDYSALINPCRSIPQSSTRIHGITDADVAHCPTLETVIPDVVEFIGDAVIIGHHITFDMRFLNKALRERARCTLRNPCVDTMLLYLSLTERFGRGSLDEVAEYCDVTIDNRHTAYGDAMAAARIFCKLTRRLMTSSDTVSSLVRSQR